MGEHDADTLNELGQHAGDEGDLAAAVAYFRASMVLGGDGAAHNLGVVLSWLERYVAAAEALRVAADAGIDDARLSLANLLADHLDKPLEAEREYRTLVASGDAYGQGDGGARIALARHLARRGDVDGARAAFEQALDDDVEEAVNSFGVWLAEQGLAADAEALYRDALAKGDSSVWRNLGNVLADDALRREEADGVPCCDRQWRRGGLGEYRGAPR